MIYRVSHAPARYLLQICLLLLVVACAQSLVKAEPARPILVSTPTSTRAIALEAVTFMPEPFSARAVFPIYGSDKATRIMLFALNLSLQAGEDASALTADAEDAAHRHYNLKVEYVGKVSGQEWLSQVNVRLDESMGDVGDVLVRISYQGVASNRVRVGIGHIGGGLADDVGAAPTPAPPYVISGRIASGGTSVSGVVVALTGAQTGTTTTDNNGAYSFTVSAVGNYTVTPSKNSYTFTPSAKSFTDLSGNRSADFEAVPNSTFTINGQVKDEESKPLSGATLTLNGTQQGTTVTDENGNYSFKNLVRGGNFTITATKPDYSFSPSGRSFNSLSADQTVNFSASLVSYVVSGRIIDGSGNGLANVPVNISNGATSNTIATNGSGIYTISLKAHGNYTVTPSPQIVNSDPQQLTITFLNANQAAANFTASRKLYVISGQVLGDQGAGLDGIEVIVKNNADDSARRVVTTNGGGLFSFSDLPAGYSFTVLPTNTSLYAFTTQSTGILDRNLSLSFSGTRRKYVVSGVVTDGQSGIDGVPVTLTGGNNLNPLTSITSGGGKFSFIDVAAGYDYTVRPVTNAYYAFNSKQELKNILSDQTASFAGALRSYTVSGQVMDENGHPLSAGTVALYSGNFLVAMGMSLDADGRYEFKDVPALYSYTVYPYYVPTHYFTAQNIPSLGQDETLNFTGVRYNFKISGVVSDRAQQGVSGVSVTLSGKVSRSATTDANGNYSFDNLQAGFDYNVTVAKTDYIFEPQSRVFYLLEDEQTDFTAIRTYRISGRVTDGNGLGLIGMTMNLSGAEASKVLTGSDGSYSFTVTTTGNYLVTPSREQDFYTFTPASQSLNNLSEHRTANFAAALSLATNPSYVLEFNGSPMSVDYGRFWPEGINLGHFFWEFWAMPGAETQNRYLISDGYGGAHALLFGFSYGQDGHYSLLGDIFDGTSTTYFLSDEGPSANEWGHYAVGWDGKSIITYYDGVPVGKQPFVGPRISPGIAWGATFAAIGGSDHQNLIGRIAQVRGYEESNPHESSPETSFAPQTVFSLEGKLLSYYFRPSQQVADLSPGYITGTHSGRLRGMTSNGWILECPDCPTPRFVLDPTAPDFTNPNNPGQINAPFNSPPATPATARVFDSFSRNNSTYILGGKGGLGTTEGGSAGPLTWRTNSNAAQPQPFGILSGHAVLLANNPALTWVSTGASNGNLDVRVERTLGTYGSGLNTGLSFRVVDGNNLFFAYTSDDESGSESQEKLTVGYYQAGARTVLASGIQMPSGSWKTLRVVTLQSGSISIYADAALVYSTSSAIFADATGAGLFNNAPGLALTNRWDNFTVLDTQ